jgi:hypothetical protein
MKYFASPPTQPLPRPEGRVCTNHDAKNQKQIFGGEVNNRFFQRALYHGALHNTLLLSY